MSTDTHEIELRFHVPPEALPRLRSQLLRGAAPLRLQARYFDTADRRLACAGIGLRLRCEGGAWVQTLKGPSADGLRRAEHNVALPAEPAQPDPVLHAEHPLGAELLRLLADADLQPTFATDIRRLRRTRRLPGGLQIELALDEGCLLAAGREQAVHELELELLAGAPAALLAHAHGLLARWPLSLDLRSKAERGERLARGEAQSPPRKAQAPALRRGVAPAEGVAAQLQAVLTQVLANASQIGSGRSQPEHLHQLRVGLRRLRALLVLVQGLWPALDALELDARVRDWMRELGLQRDRDVQRELPDLAAALAAAGFPPADAAPHDGGTAAAALLRRPAVQRLLLEVMGAALSLPRLAPPPEAKLRRLLQPRLRDWQRRLRRDAADFARLDADGRHGLRKRAKRLRYALELNAALHEAPRWLAALRALQDCLGDLRDAELSADSLRTPPQDAREAFALGWLLARQQALRARAAVLAARL
jgi:inorganic triphosphatase YgiF